jgi:hypothetical protein
MSNKKRMERDIKNMSRQCFRRINIHKRYIFIGLLYFYMYMISIEPTLEKGIIFILSLIAVQFVIRKVLHNKLKLKHKKK